MIDDDSPRPVRGRFILSIILVAAGIIALAAFLSFPFGLSFGLCMLSGGVIVGGAGALLARPNPYDPKSPRNRALADLNSQARANQLSEQQFEYDEEHSAPRQGFENVMLWAGAIPILLGILLMLLGR